MSIVISIDFIKYVSELIIIVFFVLKKGWEGFYYMFFIGIVVIFRLWNEKLNKW